MVVQADSVASTQQLIDGQDHLDERPTCVPIGTVATQNQEWSGRHQGEHLMVFQGRNPGLDLFAEVPRIGPVAHAQTDATLVENSDLVARLERHRVQHFLGASEKPMQPMRSRSTAGKVCR